MTADLEDYLTYQSANLEDYFELAFAQHDSDCERTFYARMCVRLCPQGHRWCQRFG
jgi:hypothetical protein